MLFFDENKKCFFYLLFAIIKMLIITKIITPNGKEPKKYITFSKKRRMIRSITPKTNNSTKSFIFILPYNLKIK